MADLEQIKKNSRNLRGTIRETVESDATHFSPDDEQVLKFHGAYQEDDRDERIARMKAKQERAWILMVRCKVPGGALSARQYLALDRLAGELANGTLRITTRQDMQFHGVLKTNLKALIRRINEAEVTTFGACGDAERNVMAAPAPFETPVHREVQQTARALSDRLLPRSSAYFQIWLNGEKMKRKPAKDGPDPLYGAAFLPRKFKMAFVVPPRNDVDIHSHDLGFVPHFPNGEIEGYTVLAGGGFGMDHGKLATYPCLSVPLFYIKKEAVTETALAAIAAFRDHGDRTNRKHARLKYLVAERGADWFRKEVESRMQAPTAPPKKFALQSVEDFLGWHEQGGPEGRLFCGVKVECGRIKDYAETGVRYRSGLRALAERFQCPVRLTANQNIIFGGLKPGDRAAFDALLAEHGIPAAETYTQAHRMAIACVALPTCKLALSESERVYPALMSKLDALLRELKLEQEPILFRMTGCPNGCARPYNADFAFVGRGIGKYAVYVGGSHRGNRMAGLAFRSVEFEQLPEKVRPFLETFIQQRRAGEHFSDYWSRTHANGPAPHPEQFHVEPEKRKTRLKSGAQGAAD